jgi:hypothetical protein
MKKQYLKTIGSTLIVGAFLFLAFGSDDSSSSSDSELSKKSKDEIVEILCKNELNDETDISGGYGIGVVKISLTMSTDKTFKYAIEENYANNTGSSLNATGTYEIVGNIEKVNTTGWTNKYGEDAGKFQYEQVIKFNGNTNKGGRFSLTAKLVQFGDKNGMESKWFFTHEDYSSNNQESVGTDNFRLPDEFIYP